jgi:uridine kinase
LVEFHYQKYNWKSESFDSTGLLQQKKYLIIEGVGAAQRAFHKYINRIIWIEFDADKGLERVLRRDGEKLREQMTKFLIDQAKLFENEVPKNYADYIFKGAP